MRQTVLSRLVLAALVVAGAVAFSVSPAGAQFASRVVEVTGLGGAPITVTAGEGGVEVFVPGRVDANVTNEYVPIGMGVGGPKLEAEVSGSLGGPVVTSVSGLVDVTGSSVGLVNGTIVNLTPATMAALTGERDCVDYPVGNVLIDGGVFTFASVPGQQNASIGIHNCGISVDYVACFRGWLPDGGPPPSCDQGAGVANVPVHNGEFWIVDGLADHHRLRCAACTHAGPPSGGTCLAGGSISICTPSL